jgi:cation:H+ antiporter
MGWGKGFVGTLLVAAVTSAPEVVVTISALRIGAIDMAIANLLGSDFLYILILAIDDLLYTKGALLRDVSACYATTALTAVIVSLLVVVGFIIHAATDCIQTYLDKLRIVDALHS